jgi:branched-chain amino acid transport system permease protein
MTPEFFTISMLNGVSYGLLLFMLSSGLTLIFSMMGVLNFAHTSFYMLGAYFAYTLSGIIGFWPALFSARCWWACWGAVRALQPAPRAQVRPCARAAGHLRPVLSDSGGGAAGLGARHRALCAAIGAAGAAVHLYGTQFPKSRSFVMLVALLMLVAVWLLLTRTRIGLVIQAALKNPEMVEALGHNVPRVFMLVFGGGCALAGLAGVIGGNTYVTEPAMAASVGSIIFVVVVVGGMGSLAGAFVASLLIGVVQTFAVALDWSLAGLFASMGIRSMSPPSAGPCCG